MKLHDLKPAAGSTHRRIRVGRGIAAGKGKTAGRGTKGQKSRAGASIPAWFEGGQTPIHVRVPKLRGFKPIGRIEYQVVNVGRISAYAEAGRLGEPLTAALALYGEPRDPACCRSHHQGARAGEDPRQRRGVGTDVRARGCVHEPPRGPRSRPPAARSRASLRSREPRRPRQPPPRTPRATPRQRPRATRPSWTADPRTRLPRTDARCSTPSSTPFAHRISGGGSCSSWPCSWSCVGLPTCRCRAWTRPRWTRSSRATPFLQLLDLFSGGGLASFSIIALGVNPYINASIIMQLMTGVVPRLQQLQREGEYGRNKINQYTRYLTVPMGILQAYGYLILLSSQGAGWDTGHPQLRPGEPGHDHHDRVTGRGHRARDVDRRADHRAGHRQRHQLHHLRGHRGQGARRGSRSSCAPRTWPRASPSRRWASARSLPSSTSRKGSDGSPSSTPAACAAGGCTRVAPRSCRCGSTRRASSRSSSRSASCCSRSSWRPTSRAPARASSRTSRTTVINAPRPARTAVHPAVLPAHGRLHVLLHGVHVQAG